MSILLSSLPEDADISEDLYSLLRQHLLTRLNDKIATIRSMAVAALHRLQNAEDDEEEDEDQLHLHFYLHT